MKPNPVVWFEIYVQDMARARKFYEAVFGCTLESMGSPGGELGNTEMMSFPMEMGAPGTGGMLIRMEGVPSGSGGTLVYFGCDDCAEQQSRVETAGGQIHKPKFAIGEYGFCALVVDTEGNCIGLHSMK